MKCYCKCLDLVIVVNWCLWKEFSEGTVIYSEAVRNSDVRRNGLCEFFPVI